MAIAIPTPLVPHIIANKHPKRPRIRIPHSLPDRLSVMARNAHNAALGTAQSVDDSCYGDHMGDFVAIRYI